MPEVIKKWREKYGFKSQNQDDSITFAQAIEKNPELLSDILDENLEIIDP